MSNAGAVRVWWAQEGWGVIDAPATPGGCWAHFSSLVGFSRLQVGQDVRFDYEAVAQDGYRFRATKVWPTGQEPEGSTIVVTGPTDAYRSTVTIAFDDSEESDRP